MRPSGKPASAAPPSPEDGHLDLMREVLHRVNNVAARLLLRSEMALESGKTQVHEQALRAAVASAEELGRYVTHVRQRQRELRRGED